MNFRKLDDFVDLQLDFITPAFRILGQTLQAGQSVHIGGLTRLDILEASVQTIYVILWASANISLHLGKTENAEELRAKHLGVGLLVRQVFCV
jgi:hypothetical protein